VWPTKTYAANVFPIFQAAGCAGVGCHGGARPAESLDFTSASVSYPLLVNKASTQCTGKIRVKPNDYMLSYLMNKLTGVGMCSGTQMPKADQAFTATQVDTVRAWIMSGANP
jgi:hypothetical protein